MDYDTDDDRMTTAEQRVGHDPRAAAEAIRAIACDDGVADEVRLSAAEQLPAVDPGAAAEAFRAIACDDSVGDEVRLSAAEQLASLDPPADAQAFRGISDDRPRHRHPLEAAPTLTPPPAPAAAAKTTTVGPHHLWTARSETGCLRTRHGPGILLQATLALHSTAPAPNIHYGHYGAAWTPGRQIAITTQNGGEERNRRRGRLAMLGDDPGSSALGGVSDARDRGARKPSRPRAGRRSSMSSGGAARRAGGRSRGASPRYRGV